MCYLKLPNKKENSYMSMSIRSIKFSTSMFLELHNIWRQCFKLCYQELCFVALKAPLRKLFPIVVTSRQFWHKHWEFYASPRLAQCTQHNGRVRKECCKGLHRSAHLSSGWQYKEWHLGHLSPLFPTLVVYEMYKEPCWKGKQKWQCCVEDDKTSPQASKSSDPCFKRPQTRSTYLPASARAPWWSSAGVEID